MPSLFSTSRNCTDWNPDDGTRKERKDCSPARMTVSSAVHNTADNNSQTTNLKIHRCHGEKQVKLAHAELQGHSDTLETLRDLEHGRLISHFLIVCQQLCHLQGKGSERRVLLKSHGQKQIHKTLVCTKRKLKRTESISWRICLNQSSYT